MQNSFNQYIQCSTEQSKQEAIILANIKKSQGPKSQLQDLITCHICLCLAKNLMMCPHCSKIYCELCIRKSLLIKQQCPHCRKYIRDIKSMANCDRFVNDIKGIVEEVLKQRNSENFKCQQHDVILNYFCVQCQRPVCCECKMFGSHGQHQFVHVQKKYKQKYQNLREMLAELKVCIKEKQSLTSKLQQKLTNSQIYHQQEIKQIQKLQKKYNEIYANKVQEHKQTSIKNFQKLEKQLQNLTQIKTQLKDQIRKTKNKGKSSLNKQYKQRFQHAIQQVNFEVQQIKRYSTHYEPYLSELIPNYEMSNFFIENFSEKQKQQKVIYSESVKILDCDWKLKVHPNGRDSVQGKYLSIYVMMVSKDSKGEKSFNQLKKDPMIFQYCIQLIKSSEGEKQSFNQADQKQLHVLNQNKTKSIFSREYTSSFEPGESWGYNKYIELSELRNSQFVNLNYNDCLQIRFGIRRPDFYTEYQTLCKQMEILNSEIDQNQNQQLSNDQ